MSVPESQDPKKKTPVFVRSLRVTGLNFAFTIDPSVLFRFSHTGGSGPDCLLKEPTAGVRTSTQIMFEAYG